jgi:UrcA family protein
MNTDHRNRGILTGLTAAPCTAALLCTAAFTTGALAAEPAPPAESISYVKADLSEPHAAEFLYKRIQAAARHVCQDGSVRELARSAMYHQCYERAVDEAVTKVDASALTALHRSRMQRLAAG